MLRIADALPETIVVLDEAYLEFADAPSLAAEAARRPNLVVLRTLSKAFGLAGARVGCAIGEPELIALAARALPPYPLPSLSIAAALSRPVAGAAADPPGADRADQGGPRAACARCSPRRRW